MEKLEQDPFKSKKPEKVECDPTSFKLEGNVTEVDMRICNFITLVQDSVIDIKKGEGVEFIFSHLYLYNEEPAEAYIAGAIKSRVLFEHKKKIPSQEDVVELIWIADEDIKRGEKIHFHIQNHGTNTYKFLSFTNIGPCEERCQKRVNSLKN